METSAIAVHLLLQPREPSMRIHDEAKGAIVENITRAGRQCSCTVHEVIVREDHVHVLATVTNEQAGARFISRVVAEIRSVVSQRSPSFKLSEQLHVTLLPPWHVSILSSFLRDQERYHKEHSVEEEIEEIFRPAVQA